MWQWKNGREGGCGRRERPQLSHTVNDDDDYNCCFGWKQAVWQQHTTAARDVIGGQLGQVSSNVMKEPSEVC